MPIRKLKIVEHTSDSPHFYEIFEEGVLVYTMNRDNLNPQWHLYDTKGRLVTRNQFRNDIFDSLKWGNIK